jgi:hypothetical protein
MPEVTVMLAGEAFDGRLPACRDASPVGAGFSIDLELEGAQVVAESDGFYRTVVDAFRIDGNKRSCEERLIVRAHRERLVVDRRAVWRIRQVTSVAEESRTVSAITIDDQRGKRLLVSMTGARPDLFHQDMLNGLSLSVASKPRCHWAPGAGALGSATLKFRDHRDCDVDSNSMRCCSFWSSQYQVRVHSVVFDEQTLSRSSVNLTIVGENVLRPI